MARVATFAADGETPTTKKLVRAPSIDVTRLKQHPSLFTAGVWERLRPRSAAGTPSRAPRARPRRGSRGRRRSPLPALPAPEPAAATGLYTWGALPPD